MAPDDDVRQLVHEASAIVDVLDQGGLLACPPSDPDAVPGHEAAGYMISALRRVLTLAVEKVDADG